MSRASNLAGFTTSISPPSSLSVGIVTATSVQTTSINNGPLAGMRNAIINGNFDIWQRGTSFTGGYGSDRWATNVNGSTAVTSRQAFILGQTDVPGEPTYFSRTVVTSVANAANYVQLVQLIEDVRTFANQQITVSFWAKADASRPISVQMGQRFGSGGSPSDNAYFGITKTTIGTSWQKIAITATVPSISGETLGTDNNSSLGFDIWFDAGSDFNSRTDTLGQQSGTFDIAQVQVEPGPVATPFERRPIGTELSLCQRYFQILPAMQGAMDATNSTLSVTPMFQVPIRAAPTYVLRSGTNGAHHPGAVFRNITAITGDINTVNATLNVAFGANIPGQIFAGAVTASAEL